MKKQLTFKKMMFRKKLYSVVEFLTMVWIFFVFTILMIAGNV
jgi:hypothetical protein